MDGNKLLEAIDTASNALVQLNSCLPKENSSPQNLPSFSGLFKVWRDFSRSLDQVCNTSVFAKLSVKRRQLSLLDIPDSVIVVTLSFLSAKDLSSVDVVSPFFHPVAIPRIVGLTQRTCMLRAAYAIKKVSNIRKIKGRANMELSARRQETPRRSWSEWLSNMELTSRLMMTSVQNRLACGSGVDHFVLIVMDSMSICSFGVGRFGRLGHGSELGENEGKEIKSLKGLVNIVSVSAGAVHSLALASNGSVYSFGCGDSGRLGHGNESHQQKPMVIKTLEQKGVMSITAGDHHSLALTRDGKVWSWGSGSYGKSGHGDQTHQMKPKLVECLERKRVMEISAGGSHSLFLTESRRIYSCGYGNYGQLGHGRRSDEMLPKLIEDVRGIRHILAGRYHSLAVTESGHVYSWGHLDVLRPKVIRSLMGVPIQQLSAYDGTLFSWGRGEEGQLGHGDLNNQLCPKMIDALKNVEISDISCGFSTSVVLTKQGQVLEFGKSISNNISEHRKILMPEQIIDTSNNYT